MKYFDRLRPAEGVREGRVYNLISEVSNFGDGDSELREGLYNLIESLRNGSCNTEQEGFNLRSYLYTAAKNRKVGDRKEVSIVDNYGDSEKVIPNTLSEEYLSYRSKSREDVLDDEEYFLFYDSFLSSIELLKTVRIELLSSGYDLFQALVESLNGVSDAINCVKEILSIRPDIEEIIYELFDCADKLKLSVKDYIENVNG